MVQVFLRFVCAAYLVFLTMLLLAANPWGLARVVGMGGVGEAIPPSLQVCLPFAHLVSFCLLSMLTLAARWPIPRWALIVFLVAYGGTTEIAQSFLPPRCAEWTDWLQDIVGIAIGAVFCWALGTVGRRLAGLGKTRGGEVQTGPTNDWEVVHRVMSRSRAGEESWWG